MEAAGDSFFFSISVKHLCLCYALHMCVCLCHVFDTLWDKYLFTPSHLKTHHLPAGDKNLVPQHETFICLQRKKITQCPHKYSKACVCLCVHVSKNSQWNSAPWTRVHVWENLFPTHAKASCTQVSAGQMLIQKGFFPALCPLLLHWGFASQSTASLSHVWQSSLLGPFINQQSGMLHLG